MKMFQTIFAAALWGWAQTAVFFGTRAVDPLHYAAYRTELPWHIPLIGAAVAAVVAWTFRRRIAGNAAALIFAAFAVVSEQFCQGFTNVVLPLIWLAVALLHFFPGEWRDGLSPRAAAWSTGLLTAGAFAAGLWMQISAYCSMYLLYSDWGIYYDGYVKLASGKAPWQMWFSLGDHWNPAVNLVMTLLTGFFAHPYALFAASSALIASAGPLLYILARERKLPPAAALLCAVAGLASPVLTNQHLALFYGYHPIEWLIPAALGFFIARERHSRVGMTACLAFACGIQETVFVFLFGGAALLLRKKKYRSAAIWGAGCIAAFCLIAWGILPRLTAQEGYFQSFQYAHLGANSRELLLSPVLRPEAFWGTLFRPANFQLLAILLLTILPFAAYAGEYVFAALPVFAAVLLKASYADAVTVVQWYALDATVWLLLAVVYGMARMRECGKLTTGAMACGAFAILAAWLFFGKTLEIGHYPFKPVRDRADRTAVVERIRKIIPPGAEVAASQRLRAQLFLSHKVCAWDRREPVPEWRILDFGDTTVRPEELTELREYLTETRRETPVATFNSNDRQFCIFRKNGGPWRLPFLLPDDSVRRFRAIELDAGHPSLEARAVPLPGKRQITVLFRRKTVNAPDCAFRFHLRAQNRHYYYSARWCNGVMTPRRTPENVWFAVRLPFPPGWTAVEDLRITAISR